MPLIATDLPNLLAKVPCVFWKGEVVGKVAICGQGPFTVMFDTGTAPSVIDLTLARKLNIKIDSTGQTGSGGGSAENKAYAANLPQLNIERYSMKNVECLAIDLSSLSKKLGIHLDGVLGDSVFDRHVVQFDYPRKVVRFLRKPPLSFGAKFPFMHSDSEIHLKGLRVNRRNIEGNLDTGANSAFQLTPRGITKLRLTSLATKPKAAGSTGFNGAYQAREGTLSQIDVGPIHISRPRVTFWIPNTGHDECKFDLNVGNGFWKGHVVTIDYIHHSVLLSR